MNLREIFYVRQNYFTAYKISELGFFTLRKSTNPASIHWNCLRIIPIVKMSSRISLQQPYVVATLPRSKQAQYVVGEVYGGSPGSKKRKRSELAVGIHGEGVNLYDVRL